MNPMNESLMPNMYTESFSKVHQLRNQAFFKYMEKYKEIGGGGNKKIENM